MNALLTGLLTNHRRLGGAAWDGEDGKVEKAQQSRASRDQNKQGRTADNAFQDRCLKPLGHPSSSGISVA